MNDKTKIFWLILVILMVVSFVVVKTNEKPVYKRGISAVYDNAISSAARLYRIRLNEGMDFSNGPCLTNDLMPDWVADIVHSPREKIDDLPSNQCAAYLEGRAHHFVELDLNGNLVKVE